MDKKDILLYGMMLQSDFIIDSCGSDEIDCELHREALMKMYGVTNEMTDKDLKGIEDIIYKDNKILLNEIRDNVKEYLGMKVEFSNDKWKPLKIKQYYLGNGGKEGYKYDLLYDNEKVYELVDLPNECVVGSILKINGYRYVISDLYDCEESDESFEVMWYYLEPFKDEIEVNTNDFEVEINN